ncbi:MAG: hypothetical protein CVT64_08365 [Actinobacteria bacterium HGW-Actinobacteria-4]|nr:MAG: hypothetical protein CVT64_08365 [Actinobacteria bacterium HGW-Actinobacteria-4]
MTASVRNLAIALVGVLLLGVVMIVTGFSASDFANLGKPRNAIVDGGVLVTIPLPEGPAIRRAGAVPVLTTGEYEFFYTTPDGEPIRYDPCRTLRWVLAPAGMPEGAEPFVHDAFADVQSRTGLVFEYEGYTDEVVSSDRLLFQDRYGERFAPIVVGWSTPADSPELTAGIAGLGGSSSVRGAYGDQRYLVSGLVLMNIDSVERLMGTTHTKGLIKAIIKHEIGHVVGLGHVEDTGELMHHDNLSLKDWGPGDLAGLAIVGNGPCQGS